MPPGSTSEEERNTQPVYDPPFEPHPGFSLLQELGQCTPPPHTHRGVTLLGVFTLVMRRQNFDACVKKSVIGLDR